LFTLRDSVLIQAPIERCFLLSTSIDIVRLQLGMSPTEEGRSSGLSELGDMIHWEGRQFGMWHRHVSRITAYEPNRFFQDTMDNGRFASFQHNHWFEAREGGTLLRDELRFALPYGPLGWLVGATIVQPHITRLMRRRFRFLKHLAEGQEWWKYVPKEQRAADTMDAEHSASISPW